jgi:hypothetical protein
VIDFLDPLFSEENAYFTISLPSNAVTQKESFKACIETSSSLQMNQEKMTHEEEVELEDDLQLFAKLTITDEEKRMMREVIQTVGRGSEIKLGMMYLSLSKKRAQLMHIHPLRSLATQITDEYTKQCLGKLLDHSMKRDNYLSDFSSKMKEEGAKDNVLKYVDGFCKEVKANPIQVRMYITHQEYEKLIRYLIGIQVAE